MKFTIFLLLFVFIVACQEEEKKTEAPKPLGDINLVIPSSKNRIDSVAISSINSTYTSIQAFSEDTLRFNMDKPLNDLYKITFYAQKHITPKQLWLDGENVIINLEAEKNSAITSVKNSPLHTHAKEYSSTLEKLYKNEADNSEEIDHFLLKETEANIQSPFAFAPAEIFLYRNEKKPAQLKKLDSVFKKLPNSLKNHKLSMNTRLQNILNNQKP
jgi:hypothetical protein